MNRNVGFLSNDDSMRAIAGDLDNFVEHESIRVRCMEKMGKLALELENKYGANRANREKEIKNLARRISELDRQDRKSVDRLITWASGTGNGKLIAQLMALKERHDGNVRTSQGIFDILSLKKNLKKRISRGVGTLMLCGAIAMGIGSTGPDEISITSSSSMSNKEEIHQIANVSTLFKKS